LLQSGELLLLSELGLQYPLLSLHLHVYFQLHPATVLFLDLGLVAFAVRLAGEKVAEPGTRPYALIHELHTYLKARVHVAAERGVVQTVLVVATDVSDGMKLTPKLRLRAGALVMVRLSVAYSSKRLSGR
jgi:hypothetical protein